MIKTKLRNLVTEYSLRNRNGSCTDVYSVTNSQGFIPSTDYFSKEVFSKDLTTYKIVKKGMIAYNPSRINVGSVAVQRVAEEVIVSPLYVVFSVNEDELIPEYLTYFLHSDKGLHQISSNTSGSVRDSLKFTALQNIEINTYSLEEQKEIIVKFQKFERLIEKQKALLKKLDDLVKSQFIEMFGDPVINEKGWTVVRLSEVAEMKIGPFGSLLHKEDYISGGHALVNPSHIEDGKIQVDNSLSISDEKYNELSAYHLKRNDIVLGRRGEMGRCAVVNNDGLLCGTGSMIIRPTGQMLPYFLQSVLSSPSMKLLIEERAVGVTMANLNVPIVSNLPIPMYPMEKQRAYISILEQTDKSKFRIKQSLEKLEKCYKALLQKYFG